MRAPKFWADDGWLPRLLSPLSALWCWGAEYRQSGIETFRPSVPVICVGNIVAGGTGKTPVVLALAEHLQSLGKRVHLLTRGYGGSLPGPVRVDISQHSAAQVGDEALLLAQTAPTWVARWRPDGAAAATAHGAEIIIMDDGFQNFTVAKDLSIIVVDGAMGFGNGRVMPAGPCREPIDAGRARAHAAIIIGPDARNAAARLSPLPVLNGRLVPEPSAAQFTGQRLLAFAGIGRPAKFFDMLRDEIQARLVDSIAFPDHYPYKTGDLETLIAQAKLLDATLITTHKDWVRIPPPFQSQVQTVKVRLELGQPSPLDFLLAKAIRR